MAQAFCHVSEMGVFIIHLSEIRVRSEILVRGEGRTKFYRLCHCHVALHALARRCSGEDAHLKLLALLVKSDGALGEFAENSFRVRIRSEARKSHHIAMMYHFCSFGSCDSLVHKVEFCVSKSYFTSQISFVSRSSAKL